METVLAGVVAPDVQNHSLAALARAADGAGFSSTCVSFTSGSPRRLLMQGRWFVVVGLLATSGCASKLKSGNPANDGSSSDGPVSCTDAGELGCQSPPCVLALCPTDAGSDARRADAAAFPPPFMDAGCSGDPRLLVLYCETPDQLLGTDAGRAVTSFADCPPPSVLASPASCSVGEGSCCKTHVCGPQIEASSVPSSTPDASATENRCCYLAQLVCGV